MLENEQGRLSTTIRYLDDTTDYYARCLLVGKAVEGLMPGGWLYVTIRPSSTDVSRQLEVGGFSPTHKTPNIEIGAPRPISWWEWRKTPA